MKFVLTLGISLLLLSSTDAFAARGGGSGTKMSCQTEVKYCNGKAVGGGAADNFGVVPTSDCAKHIERRKRDICSSLESGGLRGDRCLEGFMIYPTVVSSGKTKCVGNGIGHHQ